MLDADLQARLWAKVNRAGSCHQTLGQCWEWTGGTNGVGPGLGHGKIRECRREGQLRGKFHYAHRLSWEIANGPIPDGLCVRHKCDNPKCVRPEHLELGTKRENTQDMMSRGRFAKGSMLPQTVLTEADVREIRRLKASGLSNAEVGRRFAVSPSHVSEINNRKKWSWLA